MAFAAPETTTLGGGTETDSLVANLERLAKLGVDFAHCRVPDVWDLRRMQFLGERVIPFAAQLGS